MATITIARAGEHGLGAPLLDSMYRLRCEVFHKRLNWDVHVENGREHDWFDLMGPHYLVAHDGIALMSAMSINGSTSCVVNVSMIVLLLKPIISNLYFARRFGRSAAAN